MGGRSGGPSGQTRTGTQVRTGTSRVEQTDRDHGGAGSSGSHGGAGSSGGHGGAGSSGGHGGAGSSGGHGGAGTSGGHGGAGTSVPSARPLQPEPLLPLQKNFPGEVRGHQEPSGARHTEQYMTRQDSRARQTGQDIPQEPEALLGWLGS